jgi:isopentenyldiphosphate isomerase
MERWDLLDQYGNPTGRTMIRGAHMRAGQYHLVVHIWIVDNNGRILLQQRALNRRLMPGAWAATGGSVVAGEDSETAARRELAEELSIQTKKGEMTFAGRLRRRNAFTDIWILKRDVDETALSLQTEEVAQVKWVTEQELRVMIVKKEFHNYGRPYFDAVMTALRRELATKEGEKND